MSELVKYCRPCDRYKSLFAFNRASNTRDGLYNYCRKCANESVRLSMGAFDGLKRTALREKHRHKYRTDEQLQRAARNREYLREYGITVDDYDEMVFTQCGLCALCDKPETKLDKDGFPRRLSIHHNHDTGKVIALCCNNCNVGMGLLKDSPVLMRRAADLNE